MNLEVLQLVLAVFPLEQTAFVVGFVLRFAIKFELSECVRLASMCTCGWIKRALVPPSIDRAYS